MIGTGAELAEACMNVADNFKTCYVLGSFGWPMKTENQNRSLGSYAFNRKPEREKIIRNASADTFGFDCVCLIKALLWGWTGDAGKDYGGAKYESNHVPDINDSQMLSVCKDVSGDFNNIQVGEFLWTDGHCGIYAGNGQAVECTYRWDDGVQVTRVFNIHAEGEKGRYWKKHGKLPYITYVADEASARDYSLSMRNLRSGCIGEDVKALQVLLIGKGYDCGGCGADGEFGKKTDSAVIAYQYDHSLEADGIAGRRTMGSLLGVKLV